MGVFASKILEYISDIKKILKKSKTVVTTFFYKLSTNYLTTDANSKHIHLVMATSGKGSKPIFLFHEMS